MTESTAIVRVSPSEITRGPIRPVVSPAALIEAHKEAASVIREALEDGRDYGVIPGAGTRKVLLKAGGERLSVAFGLRPRYTVTSSDCDHDRVVHYIDRYKKQVTSLGVYRYTLKCELLRGDDVVGEGIGSCSTMESKYIGRPRDCENTVLKMAKKRALVDAVLGTLSLSDRFTQDVGDDEDDEEPKARVMATATSTSEASAAGEPEPRPLPGPPKLQMGPILDLAHAIMHAEGDAMPGLFTTINVVVDDTPAGKKMAFALERLIEYRGAQLNDEKYAGDDKAMAAVKFLHGELERRAAKAAPAETVAS
jgi:hypothetical protein